jgi:hypothetical protein
MDALLRERLRRCWPIIAALVVLAIVLARWTGAVAGREWRSALDARLADGGAGTNASVLDTERDHLAALRAFTFTTGLPEALAALDLEVLEELLGPVDANLGVPMVDVLDESGRVVFAFRGQDQVPPIYRQRADMGIVQRALRGEPDQYGERFTTLVVTDEGALIASTGPVELNGRVIGALLVMTPLADVLTASANHNGHLLTVYSGDGGLPLATTSPVKPRALPRSLNRLLPAEDLPITSSYDVPDGSTREQLGALVVRHEPVAWLGVADVDSSGRVAREVSLVAVLGMVLTGGLVALLTIRWRKPTDEAEPLQDDASTSEPIGALEPVSETDAVRIASGAGRTRW